MHYTRPIRHGGSSSCPWGYHADDRYQINTQSEFLSPYTNVPEIYERQLPWLSSCSSSRAASVTLSHSWLPSWPANGSAMLSAKTAFMVYCFISLREQRHRFYSIDNLIIQTHTSCLMGIRFWTTRRSSVTPLWPPMSCNQSTHLLHECSVT